MVSTELPWGVQKQMPPSAVDYGILPGKFAAQSLLVEIFAVFDRKLLLLEDDPVEKVLNKTLKKGEDTYLDNLIRTLHGFCQSCLPSILGVLIKWYEHQQTIGLTDSSKSDTKGRLAKRLLAVDYLFCIVLIDVLPQIHFHPDACDEHVNKIVKLSFHQIVFRDITALGGPVNYNNSMIVSDTFAEVLGVLSASHFGLIQNMFFSHLNELKTESPINTNRIIHLLMAMKFFRIKLTLPEIERGAEFLDKLGTYFLDVDAKQKDIKHAVAGLLVEILLPVAATIKTEANIPSLIAFVDKLYGPTYDLVNKRQHKMAAYPLLTCLLCISQSKFFFANWTQFLNATLAQLKNRDSKLSRVALESLYRLLWVYIIRNNGEGNTTTRSKLETICGSLFPKGNRSVVPREAPLNIFVKIIHFIAQQKLDFAFKEIIFDLLGCNRSSRSMTLYPERMNIGIRALMVIADGLQQKEGPPGMPRSLGPLASGTIQRNKKTYITRPLTADVARSIGLEQYYLNCRKAFDSILRMLDVQVGRPLMLTQVQTKGKDPIEILGGDTKPKLDLFRTCIAAIPRLLPDTMTHQELVELLTRLTIHMDDELRAMACQTLQNLLTECAEWREDIIMIYLSFITTQVQDTFPVLFEGSVRLLMQLMCMWKSSIQLDKKKVETDSAQTTPPTNHISSFVNPAAPRTTSLQAAPVVASSLGLAAGAASRIFGHTSGAASEGGQPNRNAVLNPQNHVVTVSSSTALHSVEGFALTLLCQIRTQPKKIAVQLMKEVKQIFALLGITALDGLVINVLDEATPYVVEKYIEHVPWSERQNWPKDFASAYEKISGIVTDNCLVNADKGNEYMQWDPWACALSGYCEDRFLLSQCSQAVAFAWPVLVSRWNVCNSFVDPNNPQNESRNSLLRTSKSKASAVSICGESLTQESYLALWQKYFVMCCALAPPNSNKRLVRSFSPNVSIESDFLRGMARSTTSSTSSKSSINSHGMSVSQFFQKVVPMLRWDQTDMKDSVVLSIGSTNSFVFEILLEELRGQLREAQERKAEKVRGRKRRDQLRLQLTRMFEVAIFRGSLEPSGLVDAQSGQLSTLLLEFLDFIRLSTENDQDRDTVILTSLRLHFAKVVSLLVNSVYPDRRRNLLPNDKKQKWFAQFTSWGGRMIAMNERRRESDVGTYVEQKAVHALCALLCCGPIFEAQKSLGDDGYLYGWLEALMASNHHTVQLLCEETLSVMLNVNDQNAQLLDWTIQMCYTKSNVVGARCFKALVMLFSKREYPCDFVCLFVLCQMFIEDVGDSDISAMATQLLHLLKKQFLDESPTLLPRPPSSSDILESSPVVRVMANGTTGEKFAKGHLAVSKQLAKDYSQLTMPIFSEVCSRIDTARTFRQSTLLSLLIPWMENIELVDSNAYLTEPATLTEEKDDSVPFGGSEEATQLVLNNLLYMTITLASEHDAEVGTLWKVLASTRDSNLQIILHYLFVMMVLSPEAMISPAKRIVQHLSQTNGIRLVELLMENLIGSNDYFKQSLSRSDMAPYYRWICPAPQSPTEEQEAPSLAEPQERMIRSDPYQLPMPAYGGHYSNLLGHLPPTSQQVTIFTRSNLSLFLISDLIGTECPGIEWRHHLPVILHIAVLGLDSPRSYVCRYSKECIINLCLLVAAQSVGLSSVANIILQNRLGSSSCSAVSSPVTASSAARGETPTFASIRHAEYRTMLLQSNAVFTSSGELLQAIVFCLSDQLEKPLWINEEAGPRQWKLDSADQLGCMARHLAEFFLQNPMDVSGPPLVVRWTDIAMKQALGNSNRHIVGRCLQIAAALCQSPREWIAPLVSRIAECVGDSHEENQTLVTCLMLYLHQTVPYLSASHKPSDHLRTSTGGGHSRSISYTPDLLRQSTTQSPSSAHSRVPHFERHSMMVDTDMLAAAAAQFQSQGSTDMPSPISSPSGLTRSKSATTLNSEHSPVEQEHITALVQLLAISVAMLESPIDHEYLLALTLLERTFEVAGSAKKEALEALAVMLKQMEWKPFPGIVGLLSKGTVIAYGYETSVGLLVKSVDLLDASVVASPNAFALIVVSIVPHCLLHFDAPTELCINAADVISQYCSTNIPDMSNSELSPADHPLHNLSTMMHQYAEHVFSRDRFQWAKCVINYLVDAVKPDIAQLIILLAEMLERSAFVLHVYLLHMIYLLVSHGDLNDASPIPINAQGVNWKEAARVLKSVVEQWNSIGGGTSTTTLNDNYDRMSIDVDLTKPPVDKTSPPTLRRANGMSLLPATSATFTGDSLKRQTNQQNKVREHLVGILTASGMKVRLPQSTSIVLSQSSSDLRQLHHEHAVGDTSSIVQPALNSAFNSSEQISHPDDLDALSGSSTAIGDHTSIATDSFPRVFKEFDFLEAEHDSISESAESCFNWLSTIRPRSMSNVDDLNESGGGAPTITGVDDEDYNAADDEEEDEDDDDQDSVDGDDEDEYTVRARIKVLPRGSGGRRSNFSRRAAAMRRYKVTVGALPGPLKSHSESEGNIPGSPASDSNDISSDRTPHQSDVERDRHSDALSSHGSDIDDEELDRDDEELEALELKSEARDEEDVDSAPKTAITIGSESEPRPESTGDSVTGGGLTEEMLFLSETASSVKCQSEISAFSEMRERAIQKKTYPLLLECNHHASGQVEQLWIGTVGDVNNDLDGEATSYAILLFSQLLRECCSKISGLFRDASHLISVSGSQSPRNINFHFSRTLEVLMKVTESPFLFVTAQFLRASNMLQQEQFSLYELREHFETFTERKEHCIRALNAVKSSVKLLMMGGGGAGLSANQEFDLSPAVLSLQRDLLLHVANDCGLNDSGSVSSLSKSGLSIGGDQYADSLILQLANKNYGHALNTLRHLRSQQGTEFGCCDTMDVEVLLMQFCRSHTLRAWAVVGSMQALNTNCTQMKETNLQLSSLVRALMVDVNAAANTKSSRVSSVTESMFMTSLH
ncbi:hypothetical protein QR680_015141 [Steinernema hermaphroditum]|uniref:Cell morphogenesis protein N-terminal domain-containing protein n=1 Tax=Steinernema hermaphroditum TaxID=289476 RepID=A0AA39IDV9_9BILA|nr:hypothetical protein QR680_015141 [Steinernema hermaphroditum]